MVKEATRSTVQSSIVCAGGSFQAQVVVASRVQSLVTPGPFSIACAIAESLAVAGACESQEQYKMPKLSFIVALMCALPDQASTASLDPIDTR